jgi:hypothetical protein
VPLQHQLRLSGGCSETPKAQAAQAHWQVHRRARGGRHSPPASRCAAAWFPAIEAEGDSVSASGAEQGPPHCGRQRVSMLSASVSMLSACCQHVVSTMLACCQQVSAWISMGQHGSGMGQHGISKCQHVVSMHVVSMLSACQRHCQRVSMLSACCQSDVHSEGALLNAATACARSRAEPFTLPRGTAAGTPVSAALADAPVSCVFKHAAGRRTGRRGHSAS